MCMYSLKDSFNGYTVLQIKRNSTPSYELNLVWIAIPNLCNWPLPSVNLCTPMTYFWLSCFLLCSVFFLCLILIMTPLLPQLVIHTIPLLMFPAPGKDVLVCCKLLSLHASLPVRKSLAGTKLSQYYNSTVDSLPQRQRHHF